MWQQGRKAFEEESNLKVRSNFSRTAHVTSAQPCHLNLTSKSTSLLGFRNAGLQSDYDHPSTARRLGKHVLNLIYMINVWRLLTFISPRIMKPDLCISYKPPWCHNLYEVICTSLLSPMDLQDNRQVYQMHFPIRYLNQTCGKMEVIIYWQ